MRRVKKKKKEKEKETTKQEGKVHERLEAHSGNTLPTTTEETTHIASWKRMHKTGEAVLFNFMRISLVAIFLPFFFSSLFYKAL